MVTFSTKKIKSAKTFTKRNSQKRKFSKKKKTASKILLKIVLFILALSSIVMFLGGIILYNKIIKPLPPIENLKDLDIAQTSSIYDRKGNLLYNIYKEKRTYIEFDLINKKMINAIIAGEDQRFWTNPGFDLIGLTRAAIEGVKTGHIGGTSTISQQLIKNTLLNNERKIERKIKEIYLSYKLTNAFTKEKIIELYLNKISFGNNAYGIEQAAKTYFDKSASKLGILESSILASLPKGPTYYSPYSHADRVMGYSYIYSIDSVDSEQDQIKILGKTDRKTYSSELLAFKKLIGGLKIKRLEENGDTLLMCGLKKELFKDFVHSDTNGCQVMVFSELLPLLNNIRIKSGENYIEYQTGRKDFILGRMLQDKYISFKEYQNAIISGVSFEFKRSKDKITYPHFVFYVKEYLEETYGKKVMEEGGLKIITTLDPELQEASQKIITKYAANNARKYGSNNAASITIDNKTGEIVSMIGGKDYYDKDNSGENNIITSKLQPGSTFKPFVYALAMEKNQIGPKTPVFDVKTRFPGGYEPNNFDGKFLKKMTIAKALNHSRNIPAIKMYYLAGKEKSIINFMKNLGVESYYDFKKYYRNRYNKEYNYGAPMALGTGEMTPLELASAYSTIASLGKKKEITPILKIYDSKGNLIYDIKRDQQKTTQAINASTAYLITSILSNKEARPSYWNTILSIPGRVVAAKTGTSTKQFKKNGKKYIFPQNLWTIGYTPNYTSVAWVGNTNGKELYSNGNGLEGAGPIWKDVMIAAHKGTKATNWSRPNGIKSVKISEHSGKLPSGSTPQESILSSEFINPPTTFDDSYFAKRVDALCNGKITDETPQAAIKEIFGLRYHSLRPNDPAWENPVLRLSGFGDFNITDEVCERTQKPSSMQLEINIGNGGTLIEGANYVELAYRSINPIIRIDILLDGQKIASYPLVGKLEGGHRSAFNIPSGATGNKVLTVKAIDNQFYDQSISRTVVLGGKDTIAPSIQLQNPARGSISVNAGDSFNLRANITDLSPIRSINIYLNNKAILTGIKQRKIVQEINTSGMNPGTYTLKIDATDHHFNTSSQNVIITILGNNTPQNIEELSEIQ